MPRRSRCFAARSSEPCCAARWIAASWQPSCGSSPAGATGRRTSSTAAATPCPRSSAGTTPTATAASPPCDPHPAATEDAAATWTPRSAISCSTSAASTRRPPPRSSCAPSPPTDGEKKPMRIHALLDDASRYVVVIEALHSEQEIDMLGLLVRAIRREGPPDALYLDNGPTYRGDVLRIGCERLGITLLHARAHDAPARGKMERFGRPLRGQRPVP